jgi:hypothetical protein
MIIMMIFNMEKFIFPQIFILLFLGLFNDESDLRVKYLRQMSQVLWGT